MEQTEHEEKPYETLLQENQALRRRLREMEEAPRRGRDTEQRENLVKLLEIKNRQLEQSFAELERGNRQLADASKRTERYYVSTLLSLVQISEARDPFFAQHSRAVASCARGIGRALGWEAERLGLLETAGHLHDFGNLGVPPEILRKAGPLEPAERALVQTHPTIARQILEPIGPLALVLDWIAQHHERPDGKGYPKGLSGDAIAPEAQVLHGAEAYVAMSSRRPWRDALGREGILKEIRAGRGTQFSLPVADALLAWEAAQPRAGPLPPGS